MEKPFNKILIKPVHNSLEMYLNSFENNKYSYAPKK